MVEFEMWLNRLTFYLKRIEEKSVHIISIWLGLAIHVG
jgi:hypothetical protein